jgi:hypothetical protein
MKSHRLAKRTPGKEWRRESPERAKEIHCQIRSFAPAGALLYHTSYPGFALLTRGYFLPALRAWILSITSFATETK